jgi:hypothetical protein
MADRTNLTFHIANFMFSKGVFFIWQALPRALWQLQDRLL